MQISQQQALMLLPRPWRNADIRSCRLPGGRQKHDVHVRAVHDGEVWKGLGKLSVMSFSGLLL